MAQTANESELTLKRRDGRGPEDLRPTTIVRDFTVHAMGSVLITAGRTMVLCTASVEEQVPRWIKGSGNGWLTAEYSLLPGSSPERVSREAVRGRQSGRTQEIQRLIGRSLRSVCDMSALGERQVVIDCDVLQADGGTRTASVTGAYVALHDAFSRLLEEGRISRHPMLNTLAAISVGVVDGTPMLDLDYSEDSRAETDMNLVMVGDGRFVEVQGTAERMPFTKQELDEMTRLGMLGLDRLFAIQAEVLNVAPGPYEARR